MARLAEIPIFSGSNNKECASMHKPSRVAIYGVIGLAGFGVGYDCGLFGPPDGHDHSAIISITTSSGTITGPITAVLIAQNVTGEGITVPMPAPPKPTQV